MWCRALRSGLYRQSRGTALRYFDDENRNVGYTRHDPYNVADDEDGTCYSVLGVAVGVMSMAEPFAELGTKCNCASVQPQVQDWIGLNDELGSYIGDDGEARSLAADSMRYSFEDLAALIESEPPGLFRPSPD